QSEMICGWATQPDVEVRSHQKVAGVAADAVVDLDGASAHTQHESRPSGVDGDVGPRADADLAPASQLQGCRSNPRGELRAGDDAHARPHRLDRSRHAWN